MYLGMLLTVDPDKLSAAQMLPGGKAGRLEDPGEGLFAVLSSTNLGKRRNLKLDDVVLKNILSSLPALLPVSLFKQGVHGVAPPCTRKE